MEIDNVVPTVIFRKDSVGMTFMLKDLFDKKVIEDNTNFSIVIPSGISVIGSFRIGSSGTAFDFSDVPDKKIVMSGGGRICNIKTRKLFNLTL